MSSLTIKSFPDKLLTRLKKEAEAARRSLTQEVLFRLENSLMKKTVHKSGSEISEINKQTQTWEDLAGKWESSMTLKEEIDALYKARTSGRKIKW
jgi:hypothetical protein